MKLVGEIGRPGGGEGEGLGGWWWAGEGLGRLGTVDRWWGKGRQEGRKGWGGVKKVCVCVLCVLCVFCVCVYFLP